MSNSEQPAYDFTIEENVAKWKGVFVASLEKILKQVHPNLMIKEDALSYIEKLIIQMLAMLCASQPHTVQEVTDRVQKKIPDPINAWAQSDATGAIEKSKNKKSNSLVMPVDKLHQSLVKEVFCVKIEHQVTIFISAVLEYIAADILKLIGNYVKNIRHQEISLPDVKVALCADKVLMNMFEPEDDDRAVVEPVVVDLRIASNNQTYEEVVKDLMLEENQYLRELDMIIKVFREPFSEINDQNGKMKVEDIFSNIVDIHELTLKMIRSLEDTVEATKEGEPPLIGNCFEELIEGQEFDVYDMYSGDILQENGRTLQQKWLLDSDTLLTLEAFRRGFKACMKYVLPRLLQGPINHFLYYCDTIKTLIDKSPNEEDKEILKQSMDSLGLLKIDIEKRLASRNLLRSKACSVTVHSRGSREMAVSKMEEVQKLIDGWDGKNISQLCNEYITEGPLQKQVGKQRLTDRYVFLLDSLIILTKKFNPQNARRSVTTGPVFEYKLKESYQIHKIDVIDRDDSEELKNAFEIQIGVKPHTSIVLVAKTAEDKSHWMSYLVSMLQWSMLERLLDTKMKEEEKKQPLRLPSPEQYRFAIEDSEDNIVFEDSQSINEIPLIRGGTLLKLVERLTYHSYSDPKFIKTFLTTYRTFCKSEELLDLLIERFEIPEPQNDLECGSLSLEGRDDFKRYRNDYIKPIMFRVLNVFRQWVDQHWHDFEKNDQLQNKLVAFLNETVKRKSIKKWVESINKILDRKRTENERQIQITLKNQPPLIEWHITHRPDEFNLMTLHPIEIARQATLLEFDMYRMVKSSEMVGGQWMKKDKDAMSPNLRKMIAQSTRFTFWLEKCILETENLEERVAVLCRVLELLMVFDELNNFCGVIEVYSALTSAPVHRLEHTFDEVSKKFPKLMRAYEEAKELNNDHFKRYIEKLRSIDPPCIPFLGMYLTNILHLEEGNPDFLPNRPPGIINFSKRRKVAEITGEIQQYQNQPYCLTVEPSIRNFLIDLDPLGDMSEKDFNDYLYEKSLTLEPRNSKQASKFERKWDYSLKSPGIKPSSSRHSLTGSLRSLPTSSLQTYQQSLLDDISEAEMPSGTASPQTPNSPHESSDDSSVFDASLDSTSMLCYEKRATFSGPGLNDSCSLFSGSTTTLCSTMTVTSYFSNDDPPPPIPPRQGRMSVGGVSLGGVSLGGVSLGGVSLGEASLGRNSLGGVSLGELSLGRGSLGGVSLGEVSLGRNSLGGISLGEASLGRGSLVGGVSLGGMSLPDLIPPVIPPRENQIPPPLPPRRGGDNSHQNSAHGAHPHGPPPPPYESPSQEELPELPPKMYQRHSRQCSN